MPHIAARVSTSASSIPLNITFAPGGPAPHTRGDETPVPSTTSLQTLMTRRGLSSSCGRWVFLASRRPFTRPSNNAPMNVPGSMQVVARIALLRQSSVPGHWQMHTSETQKAVFAFLQPQVLHFHHLLLLLAPLATLTLSLFVALDVYTITVLDVGAFFPSLQTGSTPSFQLVVEDCTISKSLLLA